MSSETKAPGTAPSPLAATGIRADEDAGAKKPVVEKIDIASLRIEESYAASCDPYNNTGQFLVDAMKKKLEA